MAIDSTRDKKGYQMSKRGRNKSDDIYRELIKILYVSPL